MLVDTHCHLDFDVLSADLDGVVARAAAAGVGRMVTINTRLTTFPALAAIAERFPGRVWCTVGVHPHQAEEEAAGCTAERIVELSRHPKVVGIGESGLDHFYDKSPRDVQEASFRKHIRACLETGLPLVVHSRDAEADTMRVLREEAAGTGLQGIMHCFSGSRQLAEDALEFGFHISFSGILTFKKSQDLRDTAAIVPMDRLLVETDAPYLAPEPHRGRPNEPAYVAHTAARLAEVKGVTAAEIAAATTANARRLYARMDDPAAAAAA